VVQTGTLYIRIYHNSLSCIGHAMAQAVSSHADPSSIQGFVVDTAALEQVFLRVLRFSPVSVIPPKLHTHLNLRAARTRRTKGGSLGNYRKTTQALDREVLCLSLRMATTATGTLQTKAYEQTHNAQHTTTWRLSW